MKKLATSIAALFFAGSVYAASDAEIYHGFEVGNPDLASDVSTSSNTSGGIVVTDKDIYHGFEKGNSDLSTGSQPGFGDSSRYAFQSITTDKDIYHGFEIGNQDLSTELGVTTGNKGIGQVASGPTASTR